jgi:hypothetical protein
VLIEVASKQIRAPWKIAVFMGAHLGHALQSVLSTRRIPMPAILVR